MLRWFKNRNEYNELEMVSIDEYQAANEIEVVTEEPLAKREPTTLNKIDDAVETLKNAPQNAKRRVNNIYGFITLLSMLVMGASLAIFFLARNKSDHYSDEYDNWLDDQAAWRDSELESANNQLDSLWDQFIACGTSYKHDAVPDVTPSQACIQIESGMFSCPLDITYNWVNNHCEALATQCCNFLAMKPILEEWIDYLETTDLDELASNTTQPVKDSFIEAGIESGYIVGLLSTLMVAATLSLWFKSSRDRKVVSTFDNSLTQQERKNISSLCKQLDIHHDNQSCINTLQVQLTAKRDAIHLGNKMRIAFLYGLFHSEHNTKQLFFDSSRELLYHREIVFKIFALTQLMPEYLKTEKEKQATMEECLLSIPGIGF